MSNVLPPVLTARRIELTRSIDAIESEIDEREAELRQLRATVIEARAELRGIEAAVSAYASHHTLDVEIDA